ncbi:MAG: GAF domain-containing sensor histidine kinase [Gemmatimonadaceae bacterium]|nr:GAF domain-containing sensor histidine kinase [Gemmatimonadaceae bacterium]
MSAPTPTRWSALPLPLVVVLLLASVLIPARETWRIMHLLRETTEVIEPARTLVDRLELGLTTESSALERFAASGDSADRARYLAAADDNRRLAAIDDLARMLGGEAVGRTFAIRERVTAWRRIARTIVEDRVPAAQRADALRSERASYEAAIDGIASLATYLSAEGSSHRELIRESERSSLVVNAALVFVALAAVFAVSALRDRERRLTVTVERRAQQEAALREAAEALAAAFTVEDVTQQIVQSALRATEVRSAFVEQIAPVRGDAGATLVVRASAGEDAPPVESTIPYGGSCTELALETNEPLLIPDLGADERRCAAAIPGGSGRAAIVVPLGHGGAPIGALFVLGARPAAFAADDLAWARTFGHLAMLAYEKVRLLDEARAGRAQLERVIKSRSRLMRGFSHDVKNPLGAADGYAELLTAGVYGELSAEQHESVRRIRRSQRGAIDLIEDLHEMARAETGNIHLSLKLVDLADVVRASGEEYRAVAEAAGLTLTVDVPDTPFIVMTDRVRVTQILSNLLSNAIKYTARGSIELRVHGDPAERAADRESWAAIEVRDTGRGIVADKLDAIFEEFVRLGPSEKSGAGLGLAVSQRLAQALGGRIEVESEVGRGSTFTLWVPAQKLEAPAETVLPPAGGQPAVAVSSRSSADDERES